ncbi:MAG: hypothetical protein QOF78_3627, partial [Phycisphaerales bacterium]|nr:hypothetical protein [Phycisphaerales bacterium]
KMLPVTSVGVGTQGLVAPLASKPLSEEGWRVIRGNLIFPQDARYAYVPLYRRNGTVAAPAPTAQIYIITVQCRSTLRREGTVIQSTDAKGQNTTKTVLRRINQEFDFFDYGARLDTTTTPYTNPNNLAPRRVKIKAIKDNPAGDSIDVLTFDMQNQKTLEPNQNLPGAAAQGCFVVMENSGQIYRLGTPRDEPNGVWELMPGSDLMNVSDEVSNVDAFIVGREWVAPYGTKDFIGTGQDISIFTTFIPVAQ